MENNEPRYCRRGRAMINYRNIHRLRNGYKKRLVWCPTQIYGGILHWRMRDALPAGVSQNISINALDRKLWPCLSSSTRDNPTSSIVYHGRIYAIKALTVKAIKATIGLIYLQDSKMSLKTLAESLCNSMRDNSC